MAQTCQQHAYKKTLCEKYSLSFKNTLLLIFKALTHILGIGNKTFFFFLLFTLYALQIYVTCDSKDKTSYSNIHHSDLLK